MGPSSLLLLLSAAASAAAQKLEPEASCPDPPWNNELAKLVVEVLEAVRPFFVHGMPDLGVPPLDPFGPLGHLLFHIDQPALRLDGSVNDTLVAGLSTYAPCRVDVSIGLSQRLSIDLRLDALRVEGLYDVDGVAVSVLPLFGHGHFGMDVFEAALSGGAKILYNPIKDRASIRDLSLDLAFGSLQLELQCILGCGDMADMVNGFVSDIAPSIWDAVWGAVEPILTQGLEDGINDVLKNVSISDIITMETEVDVGIDGVEAPLPLAEEVLKKGKSQA